MSDWVIVVDDDVTNLKMAGTILSKNNMRVTALKSGQALLNFIAENDSPDLILLDYEMPVTSGPQVLEMIRSETKVDHVPVMFLTGKGDRESVLKVVGLKPEGYLLKNLPREKILDSLEEFFAKQHAEELRSRVHI